MTLAIIAERLAYLEDKLRDQQAQLDRIEGKLDVTIVQINVLANTLAQIVGDVVDEARRQQEARR